MLSYLNVDDDRLPIDIYIPDLQRVVEQENSVNKYLFVDFHDDRKSKLNLYLSDHLNLNIQLDKDSLEKIFLRAETTMKGV